MVVPDLGLICEIMLMAEGFQVCFLPDTQLLTNAEYMASQRHLSLSDLLSTSKHYDWKLRAIKTTLYVAGGMKRSAPELTEDKVRSLPPHPGAVYVM